MPIATRWRVNRRGRRPRGMAMNGSVLVGPPESGILLRRPDADRAYWPLGGSFQISTWLRSTIGTATWPRFVSTPMSAGAPGSRRMMRSPATPTACRRSVLWARPMSPSENASGPFHWIRRRRSGLSDAVPPASAAFTDLNRCVRLHTVHTRFARFDARRIALRREPGTPRRAGLSRDGAGSPGRLDA